MKDLHAALEDASPGAFALLTYDYFGRGESDSPEAHYSAEFYVQQAEELLLHLNVLSNAELTCSPGLPSKEGSGTAKSGDKAATAADDEEEANAEKDVKEEKEEAAEEGAEQEHQDEKERDVLFAGRKIAVLGYSFGGATSTQFVSRHTERVSKWALSGAWVTWTAFPMATTVMVKTSLTAALLYKCYWMAMNGALEQGFEDAKTEENQRIIAGMMEGERPYREADPNALKRALMSTFAHFRDTKKVMAALASKIEENHQPDVTFAWGEKDQIAPYHLAEAMHQLMPTASRLEPIDGNHNDIWLVEERAAKFRQVLVNCFLPSAKE
eukprot:CAMPEP_0114604846 /NCGR_PEP_ID=MMETSP0168-20121206/754_1 /TAXON_ID=95228 ORGANISM="Vannella sp., Strain DIVA3 517/6/12" /NCGR_SAMPLE_ID=MMETSP0168 /ASSEMBLY_ACC=CAM_ASM_000044 /LENGTH=325 /DNA_ID=CAMNT_0001815687 /DNA_START=35 /DNA_END=1012 /DNA_ORIENTATION=+